MTAKEYLEQAQTLDRQIDSKIMVLDRLRALATRTTSVLSGSVVSRSRNEHSMEDAIAKIVDMEQEINGDIDRLVEIKEKITQMIRRIPDPDCQTVLELRYLCYKSWEEIANMMNRTKSNLYKIHTKALEMAEVQIKNM